MICEKYEEVNENEFIKILLIPIQINRRDEVYLSPLQAMNLIVSTLQKY